MSERIEVAGNDKSYCEGCVNCIKKGNLHHDIVEMECEKGFNVIKESLISKYVPIHTLGCIGFDSGSYKGKDIELFKDVIGGLNHTQKCRKQRFDYYENDWRA